jgi:hypothetical protein
VPSPEQHAQVQTARRAVSEAAAALSGAERGGVRLDTLLHYGAVDIDPQHLVVWILLSGKPDDQLPEWMPIVPGQLNTACRIDYQWLLALREQIVQRFREASWPRPQEIAVYADSSHRVHVEGRHYFRG